MWVDQCNVGNCLKMWCSTSKACLSDTSLVNIILDKAVSAAVILYAGKDFFDMPFQEYLRICYFFTFYICVWCWLKWYMCSYASKVVHIAVHTLGFLICELKIYLQESVISLCVYFIIFNLDPGCFLCQFLLYLVPSFILPFSWLVLFLCYVFSLSQPVFSLNLKAIRHNLKK